MSIFQDQTCRYHQPSSLKQSIFVPPNCWKLLSVFTKGFNFKKITNFDDKSSWLSALYQTFKPYCAESFVSANDSSDEGNFEFHRVTLIQFWRYNINTGRPNNSYKRMPGKFQLQPLRHRWSIFWWYELSKWMKNFIYFHHGLQLQWLEILRFVLYGSFNLKIKKSKL